MICSCLLKIKENLKKIRNLQCFGLNGNNLYLEKGCFNKSKLNFDDQIRSIVPF